MMLESRVNGGRRHSRQRNAGMHPCTPSTECAVRRGNGETPSSALHTSCRRNMQ